MGGAVSISDWEQRELGTIENAPDEVLDLVLNEIEDYLFKLAHRWCKTSVQAVIIKGNNFPNRDDDNLSDPYVKASLFQNPQNFRVTEKVRNSLYPSWGENGEGTELNLDFNATGLDGLLLEVFDSDSAEIPNEKDDLLGRVVLPLRGAEGHWHQPLTVDVFAPLENENQDTKRHSFTAGMEVAKPTGQLTLKYRRNLILPEVEAGTSIREMIRMYHDILPDNVTVGDDIKNIKKEAETVLLGLLRIVRAFCIFAKETGTKIMDLNFFKKPQHLRRVILEIEEAYQKGEEELNTFLEKLEMIKIKPMKPNQENFPNSEEKNQITQEAEQSRLSEGKVMEEPEQFILDIQRVAADKIAIRKEIRSMPEEEQERFVAAVKKLMESEKAGESEWLRIAGYHGWPSNDAKGYCKHRSEAFPGWHRAYLIEMEKALQKADLALGNDGSIGLPYWDFSNYPVNGQILPDVIRKHFSEGFTFPENFFPEEGASEPNSLKKFKERKFSRIRSEEKLKVKLDKAQVLAKVTSSLNTFENTEHWQFSSTENKVGESVESPHNTAHMCIGYPLSSLKYAAFHPAFWLLHCNVDRIYEKYLNIEGREECLQECISHQMILSERNPDHQNLFSAVLIPFPRLINLTLNDPDENTKSEEGFLLKDTFADPGLLGFKYDKLPFRPKEMLQEPPTWIFFRDVDVVNCLKDRDGESLSFEAHILVTTKEQKQTLKETLDKMLSDSGEMENIESMKNYAGSCSFFAGKGSFCPNCQDTKPVNVKLNINDVIDVLSEDSSTTLRRHHLDSIVIMEDEHGDFTFLSDLSQKYGESCTIPFPKIVGPMFEKTSTDLSEGTGDQHEVKELQLYLEKYGFYGGIVDGVIGPKTAEGITNFQKFNGIKDDGIVGPITKVTMTSTRHDSIADMKKEKETTSKYKYGQHILYWIGTVPGYLNRKNVQTAVSLALNEWANRTGVFTFEEVTDRQKADFILQWVDHADSSREDFRFEGPGGEIARADENGITFDVHERWLSDITDLISSPRRSFQLLPVVLHEVGHVLGLHHSSNPMAVMSPYYVPTRIKLTEADIKILKELYPVPN